MLRCGMVGEVRFDDRGARAWPADSYPSSVHTAASRRPSQRQAAARLMVLRWIPLPRAQGWGIERGGGARGAPPGGEKPSSSAPPAHAQTPSHRAEPPVHRALPPASRDLRVVVALPGTALPRPSNSDTVAHDSSTSPTTRPARRAPGDGAAAEGHHRVKIEGVWTRLW